MEFVKLRELLINDTKNPKYDVGISSKLELLEFNILNKIPFINEKKQLSIIASRPGMGKSTFMLQVATTCALIGNLPCYIFSLKETKEEIFYRIFSFVQNKDTINQLPIEIYSDKKLAIDNLEKAITDHISDGIVFVDSLELVDSPSYRRTIAKLKSIAVNKNLHVVLVASLPRIVGNIDERLKELSKLKHFNGADNIMVLHREPFDFEHPEKSHEVELIVTDGCFSNVTVETLYWQRILFAQEK